MRDSTMKSMPRVVSDQKAAFESNELFRRLSRDAEVKYTGYRDRPPDDRQTRFQNGCQAGRSEIAFVATGMNLSLLFFNWDSEIVPGQLPSKEFVNFDQESGKVFLKSPFIMNGVCVIWKGWISLTKLEGMGKIEFDEEHARYENAILQSGMQTQHLVKMGSHKQQNHKHPSSNGTPGHHEKHNRH